MKPQKEPLWGLWVEAQLGFDALCLCASFRSPFIVSILSVFFASKSAFIYRSSQLEHCWLSKVWESYVRNLFSETRLCTFLASLVRCLLARALLAWVWLLF